MRFDDKEFLQQPEHWPGGVCCMKRRKLKLNPTEALADCFGQFTSQGSDGRPTVIVIDLNSMKKVGEESYPDLDALLKEWMVD